MPLLYELVLDWVAAVCTHATTPMVGYGLIMISHVMGTVSTVARTTSA